jgi:cytochrome c-type biogenesis protein CcmH/NrfG
MVFAVAGMIFGFVLGYMAANLGEHAEARPAARFSPPASLPAAPASARTPAAPPDPDELRALEGLAGRDKSNVQARVQLGNLFMDHAQYDQAARWYREALALDPENLDVRVDLGACLVTAGRPAEGLPEFERALKKDPTHKKALFNKGVALMQSGRPREAVTVWEDLLKRYPSDPQLEGLKGQIDRIKAARGGGAS